MDGFIQGLDNILDQLQTYYAVYKEKTPASAVSMSPGNVPVTSTASLIVEDMPPTNLLQVAVDDVLAGANLPGAVDMYIDLLTRGLWERIPVDGRFNLVDKLTATDLEGKALPLVRVVTARNVVDISEFSTETFANWICAPQLSIRSEMMDSWQRSLDKLIRRGHHYPYESYYEYTKPRVFVRQTGYLFEHYTWVDCRGIMFEPSIVSEETLSGLPYRLNTITQTPEEEVAAED